MKVLGKVALITGAAEGLGKGFAETLLKRAAKGVGIVDVNAAKGKATEEEFNARYGTGKALFLQCDVRSAEQLADAFKKTKDYYKQIDIVVNNAGIGDESNWDAMIDINLKAVVHGSYLAKEYLCKNNTGGNGGLLINISSMAGLVGQAYGPVYTATKQGVIGFTRNLIQYDPSFTANNIRCNILCPTYADTAIITKTQLMGEASNDPMIKAFMETVTPLPISRIVEGFMKLVDEEEHHGEVMRITHEKGIDFQKYGRRPASKM